MEIDALRGLAIVGMLVVNVATAEVRQAVPQVEHVAWHGLHAADVVFPAFLFVAGCAMALSGGSTSFVRIARRVVILFGLGLLLNAIDSVDPDTFRVMGVLQRIALSYGLAAVMMRRGGPVGWAVGATALAGLHWVALVARVDGFSSLTPGGNGVAAAVDRVVLGPAHSYLGLLPDPEGLLSTLGGTATILSGALAMTLWRHRRGTVLLALASVISVAAGYGWSQLLPLNKILWTGSYVLVTAGISGLLLVGLVLVNRVGGSSRKRGSSSGRSGVLGPVAALGRNALAVYVITEALRRLARRPLASGTSPLQSLITATTDLTGSALTAGWLVVVLAILLASAVASVLAWRNLTLRA